jgi:hypothetical protein
VPTIHSVHTLAAVAVRLGVSEDLLHELSIDMFPEDGCVAVYGPDEAYTPGFTQEGIEYLKLRLDESSQLDSDRGPLRMGTF